MAARKSEDLASYYESLLQKHQETAMQVVSQIQQVLLGSQDGGPGALPQAEQEKLQQALAAAKQMVDQQYGLAKSGKGKPTAATPESGALKTISAEGQPTGDATHQSVFGQMFNSQQALTTAGTMALAQALGSKYMIGMNNKVNVSEDTKGLGALSAIIKPGLTAAQILTTLMFNQDSGTIQSIQRQLVAAGYLDPLHTTNLQIGQVSTVNDPTLQALANLLEGSSNHNTPVQKMLATGSASKQGKDFANLWDSITSGQPFSVTGQQTTISSPESLAGTLRQAAANGNGGKGVLSGGAGQNPSDNQTAEFVSQAQQFQMEHPATVTTQYVPQPGLGISGFTRFPLQKSQTSVGGADSAAMDQFTYNWLVQNMGPDVAAQGASNILSAFNQLLGLNAAGTGSAPSTAAGGAS